MHFEHLSCPICFEGFDSDKHLPRMLPVCGHSICHTCLSTLIKNSGNAKCPLDKKILPSSYNGIEAFPVNYLVTQLLEPKSEKELCEFHNEALRFVCLADMTKLCDTCIWEGKHSDHKIKPIKLIQLEAEAKKKEVDVLLGKVNDCYQNVCKDLEEKKTQILKTVREKFAEMENRLKAKEKDLILEINNFFAFGQDLSDNLIGALQYHIMHKQISLKESFKAQEFLVNKDFFQDISEFIEKSSSELDSTGLQNQVEKVKQGTKDIIESFNGYFGQLSFINDTELFPSITFLENMFKETCENVTTSLKAEVKGSSLFSKVKTTFCFQFRNDCLEIINGRALSETTLELEKWREAQELNLELSQGPFSSEDVQTFSYIWKTLGKLKTFKLKISSNNASREIVDIILQNPKKFSAVEIDITGLQFKQENPIVMLIDKMFTNNTDLKSVSLILDEAKVNTDALQKILKSIMYNHKMLEEFMLSASDTDIKDSNMDLILSPMPKMKRYSLNLKNTNITDKTIQKFFVTVFPLMLDLEEFSMYLYNTKLKDSTIVTAQLKFNKIRVLQLDFGKTLITDKTLDLINHLLIASNQRLEECFLSFGGTHITDQGLLKFSQSLPNMKDLFLGVYHTDISDISLRHFVNTLVRSMSSLEKLQMFLQGSNITDSTIEEIASIVPDVKEMSLNLNHTAVTDKSLQPFLINRLRSMETLRELKIKLANTSVSKGLQDQIEELAQNIKK